MAIGRKLAVGHFLNADFQAVCEECLPSVREVFFAWPGVASCRPATNFTPELRARMIGDLKWSRANGLELDTLFNCNCYGDISISAELADLVSRTLGEMDAEGLFPETVTTTSPFVAKIIRDRFPSVKIRWSVNQRVHGTVGFEYVLDDFDSFYVSRERHRDLAWLEMVSAWAREHGKTIGMQANSGCLRQCPYQTFHDNLHGHDEIRQNAIGQRDFGFSYFLCRRTFSDPAQAEEFLRGTWIRPEDMPLYARHVDFVKLSTRRHPDPGAVVRAYSRCEYSGDLAMLMDPVFPISPAYDNEVFKANAVEWNMIRNCPDADNCRHCGRCSALRSKFL